MENTASVRY